jgi:nucleoside-diphosphate-sugar epimerase
MKILVTGGSGFIGSHLCEYLLKKGNEIICIDNLSSGKKENIKHLLRSKNFRFIEHDISEPLQLNAHIDQIYHLASRASPLDFKKYAVEIMMANSFGTYNMLNLARKNRAKFLFASSSEVYGDPLEHPQKETYWGNVNPIGVRSCYDESKRFGEALTMAFHRKFGVDVKIARIFNTYGERMYFDGRVICTFIKQALKNEPITVFGDGKQTRSFCYVGDMVEGLVKLMNSEYNDVFNLGSPYEIRINDLANLVKKIANSKSKIVFRPLPEDDPKKRNPDISKARKKLGWKPKIDLENGLKKTIEWYKNNRWWLEKII